MRRRKKRGCLTYILGFILLIIAIPYITSTMRNNNRNSTGGIKQSSDNSSGGSAEKKNEVMTEQRTELVTEQLTEKLTEVVTEDQRKLQEERTSEAINEIITEKPIETEFISEAITELKTEKQTEDKTEMITEKTTEAKKTKYRCTSNLNVRNLPSTEGNVIGKVAQNDIVDVIEIENNWARINYGEGEAYVSANYLTIEEEIPDSSESGETPGTQETNENIPVSSKASVSYSTNDEDTVKNGDTGVYSYKSRGGSYDNYYIIDFDEGYVYFFSDGNGSETCERLKIDTGNLNTVLIVTYHDGNDTWQNGLHFKWKNQPDHMVLQDNYGTETDFYTTDLDKALAIKKAKTIVEY